MNDFRQYVLIGGMPQAVLEYAKTKNFEAVDTIKRRILKLYRDDVSKFAEGYEDKVFAIFDGIPGQLSKKEKKYRLSSISKQARFRSYEDSFVWLNEAMVVNTCFNATDPGIGLALSADFSTQKCYMADTGLLITENKKIAPIEVKSGSYKSNSSLDKFKKKFSSKLSKSYILHTKDVLIKDDIICLPIYMAMFL